MACVALSSSADLLDDARKRLTEGDFWQARKLLDSALSANSNLKQNAQYNYLLGACEFEAGNYGEAEKLLSFAKQKGNAAANLYLGRLAFLDYDFEKATELYGDFRKYQEKTGATGAETLQEFERQLNSAEQAIDRVEKIVVIDSIALPADNFIKEYKLPSSAGLLLMPEEMPLEDHRDGAVMAFMNEGEDFMMWGEPDSVGNVRLVESLRLVDGTWQEPTPTPELLNKGGYADFPFMMADGVTLYYSSTGNDTMGGYDIFVVTRDPSTGEYLQPQNIGMPFNSPYDDYMLAIDEENGVGWWATDRNRLGDKITVYVYLINDLRKNYDPDDENILEMARLSDYKATWNPDDAEKYREILAVIDEIDPDMGSESADFYFPVGDGLYYTSFDDFKSTAARDAMQRYLAAQREVKATENSLAELRRRYSVNHADNVKQEILRLEKEIEQQRADLISKRSDVYRFEKGKK